MNYERGALVRGSEHPLVTVFTTRPVAGGGQESVAKTFVHGVLFIIPSYYDAL